jgi:hypothetical protein
MDEKKELEMEYDIYPHPKMAEKKKKMDEIKEIEEVMSMQTGYTCGICGKWMPIGSTHVCQH